MERPNALYAGIGLGLVLAGVWLVPVGLGYWPAEWWSVAVYIGLAGVGLPLFWEWLAWKAPETDRPAPAPAMPTARYEQTVIHGRQPGVMFRYQPATIEEQEWYTATVNFLMWARYLGSLSSPKHLQAGSVKTPQDWMDVTEPLAAFRAIVKENGRETRYAPNWDSTRLLNAVESGLVKWDLDKPAPKLSPFPGAAAIERANVANKGKALEAA